MPDPRDLSPGVDLRKLGHVAWPINLGSWRHDPLALGPAADSNELDPGLNQENGVLTVEPILLGPMSGPI
jgi:hypothetical protein